MVGDHELHENTKATAFGSFGYGWQQLWKYFLHLFLIAVVVGVANVPT